MGTKFCHDLWVNWCNTEEFGYNIHHFFEWSKDDVVELLDQVPVIKVTDELFDFILNDLDTIPKQLMEDIKNKAYIRKNHERKVIKHCCVISNGKDTLAFDTLDYDTPMRKSRLIPRQHAFVLELIIDDQPTTYEFEPIERDNAYELLSPHPLTMVGLTRRERQLKTIFNMGLDDILHKKSHSELAYWFTEIVPNGLEQIKHNTYEEIKDKLITYVKDGWKPELEEVIKMMGKYSEFVKSLYEMELEKKYIMG